MIEAAVKKKMDEFCQDPTTNITTKEENLVIYHRLTYGSAYRAECQALRGIIDRGVTPKQPLKKIQLRIFCKPNLVSSMIMKNNTATQNSKEMCANVVYKFTCSEEICKSPSKDYVGHTQTTIRKRMLAHRNQGAIHQHFIDVHDRKPTLQELIEGTQIIHRETNFSRLLISEAVSIALQKPTLNIQQEAENILPSSRGRRQVRAEIPPQPRQAPSRSPSTDTSATNEERVESLIRCLRPRPSIAI